MILLTERAEPLLMEHVRASASQSVSERAILIPSPQSVGAQAQEDESPLSDRIAHILKERDAKLYACEDGDVIVVGRDLTVQDYKRVQHLLDGAYHLPEFHAQYYEKGVSWYQFLTLCREKQERFLAQEKHRELHMQRLQKERLRNAALNQQVPEEMLASIARRRASRTHKEVLVVEDDLFSRTLVRTSLRHEMGVTLAQNGREAIGAYAAKAPDITFLDIDLPDVSGHEVLARLLQIDPQACIIILSGHGDQGNITRAMSSGAKGFIAKPFTKEKLMFYIRQCLSKEVGGNHAH